MRLCLKRRGKEVKRRKREETGGIGKERQSLNCPPICVDRAKWPGFHGLLKTENERLKINNG